MTSSDAATNEDRSRRAPELALVLLYLLLALFVIPVYPHFASPNEVTRWLVAAAVVDDGTLEVSRQLSIVGPRVEDLAEVNGKVYSNKTPGATLVALPGYVIARAIAGRASADSLRLGLTLMRLFASTLPLILCAVAVRHVLASWGASRERQRFSVMVLLFCTPLFAYGMLLFAHALSAAALFAAWVLLFAKRDASLKDAALAGACIGLAVLSELPLAIPGLVLVIASFARFRWRGVLAVCAGGLPFALVLAGYNQLIFGNPLQLASGHEKFAQFREMASSGLFGIGLPTPQRMGELLFDLSKGLFIFSPVLLIGLERSASLRIERAARVTLVLVPVATLLVYGGYANWHGGWTVGPRYILAAVPFLVMLLGAGAVTRVEALFAGWSACAVVVTSLVFPFVPTDFPLPWGSFSLPLLSHGMIAPNLFHFAGRALAVTIPLAVAFGAVLLVAERRWLAAAGIALALLAGFFTMRSFPLELKERLSLAYIADVYFEQHGVLESAAPPALPPPPRLLARRNFEMQLPPKSWPF